MENLINKQFGRLTVLSQFRKNNHSYCHCQCTCGTIKDVRQDSLKNGSIKSCGCLHKEIVSANYEDLTGQKFNNWTVLQKVPKPSTVQNRGTYWLCECACGTQRVVWGKSLKDGSSKSCGCIKGNVLIKDLTGQKFGWLTVIKLEDNYVKGAGSRWICKCKCGNLTVVSGASLVSNHTKSCGCMQSYGEELVATLLSQLNIQFKRQYTFPELRDKDCLRFDFGIVDSNNELKCLIEIQGRQHYVADPLTYGWNTEDHLKITQKHDKMKMEYCQKHQIKLICIQYKDLDTLTQTKLKELICLE